MGRARVVRGALVRPAAGLVHVLLVLERVRAPRLQRGGGLRGPRPRTPRERGRRAAWAAVVCEASAAVCGTGGGGVAWRLWLWLRAWVERVRHSARGIVEPVVASLCGTQLGAKWNPSLLHCAPTPWPGSRESMMSVRSSSSVTWLVRPTEPGSWRCRWGAVQTGWSLGLGSPRRFPRARLFHGSGALGHDPLCRPAHRRFVVVAGYAGWAWGAVCTCTRNPLAVVRCRISFRGRVGLAGVSSLDGRLHAGVRGNFNNRKTVYLKNC